jgi:hypothetical protein
VTKTPAMATPTGTCEHASSRPGRAQPTLGLVLLAANLRPARAPDPTATRNVKVDSRLYTSVIGFLNDKVLRSSVGPDCRIVCGRTEAKGGNKWKGSHRQRNGQR